MSPFDYKYLLHGQSSQSWFEIIAKKFRTRKFHSRTASLPFAQISAIHPKNSCKSLKLALKIAFTVNGILGGMLDLKHEVLFGTFHPEIKDFLYRCSIAPENFPLKQHKLETGPWSDFRTRQGKFRALKARAARGSRGLPPPPPENFEI